MKKQFAFVLAIVLCLILSSCSQEVSLSFPFEAADVEHVEMFSFIDPTEAEKKVLTEQEDIQNLYQFLNGLAEINARLSDLKPGQFVTVVYYCDYTQEYHQLTGKVSKVDPYWKAVTIGNISIDFAELYQIEMVF